MCCWQIGLGGDAVGDGGDADVISASGQFVNQSGRGMVQGLSGGDWCGSGNRFDGNYS